MNEIIMQFEEKSGGTFQLFIFSDDDNNTKSFFISSDAIDVSEWGGGCYWCAEFESLGNAVEAMGEIIKNSEIIENNGNVDKSWLIEKYGKGTC